MRFKLAVVLFLASFGSVLIAASLPDSILAGDAANYRERMVELFSGKVPYFQFPFEHQPVMIVPLALAWILGGSINQSWYVLLTALLSFSSLLAVLFLLDRAGDGIEERALPSRWLLTVIPLLPFLLFRNDGWSVLLTVGAIVLAMSGIEAGSFVVAAGGILAKVWTAVLIPIDWWRRQRGHAVGLALITATALAINFSPPVQEIQRSGGLHTETLVGSGLGLTRVLQGSDLGIIRTATAYIDAPAWALLLNGLIGLSVILLALARMRGQFAWSRGWTALGALTIGGLLASPFFSPQYVAWMLPFAVQRRRWAVAAFVISTASLAMVLGWYDLFSGTWWWWAVATTRNLLLLALGFQMALALRVKATSPNPMK